MEGEGGREGGREEWMDVAPYTAHGFACVLVGIKSIPEDATVTSATACSAALYSALQSALLLYCCSMLL